jgi:CBS-domain-containing membrane protein
MRVLKLVLYKETLISPKENVWSFLGAFFGIGLIAYIQRDLLPTESLFLIGSFGASAVLIYGAIQSPLAQPRNVVGGHVFSALVGVTIQLTFPDILWLKASTAVGLSIVLMQMTKTLHPPGGATALIAVIGSEKIKSLGYLYVISPVLSGCLVLLLIALIFNNATTHRSYPHKSKIALLIKKYVFHQ